MNRDSSSSGHDGIGRLLSRIGMVAGLYLFATIAAMGMYVAGVLLAATAAWRAWGWPGAWGVVAGCMGVTALGAILIAKGMQRSDRERALISELHRDTEAPPLTEDLCDEEEGSDDHGGSNLMDGLADLLGYRSRKEVWIDAASVLLAVVAVLGPLKVVRLGARVLSRGMTMRSLLRVLMSNRR